MRDLANLDLNAIRTGKERALFAILLLLSVIVWAAVVVSVVGLLYGLFIGLFILFAHALFVAHIRGNAVRIGPQQLPDLHARVEAAGKRLGLSETPATYVMQQGGLLNALATRFLSRNFVILYTDLLEACGDTPAALDFVIGHELGHHALGHLRRQLWVAPGRLLPWLGTAYSRACEYSCDRAGLAVAADLDGATRGLTILAAGGVLGNALSIEQFVEQARDTTGFWAGTLELNLAHPYLSKRARALKEFAVPGSAPAFSRTLLAYPLAPLLGAPAASMGGAAGSGGLVAIAVIGVMATVAIPQFQKFIAHSKQSEAKLLLGRCAAAQADYFAKHNVYGESFEELGMLPLPPPTNYTLYMGSSEVGVERELPDPTYRGFAQAEQGYACVAVGNIDDDALLDVWTVDSDSGSIRAVANDAAPAP